LYISSKSKISPLLLIFCLLITFKAHSLTLNEKRKLFLSAESALEKKRFKEFLRIERKLKDYPLYPYLRYSYIVKKIRSTSYEEYANFISKYQESHLAEKLTSQWLKVNAKHKNWLNFVRAYNDDNNISLKCDYLWAKHSLYDNNQALESVSPIWLHGSSRPKNCDKLFYAWEEAGYLTRPLIWQRIKLAIKSNNISLAKYLAKKLQAYEHKFVDLWLQVNRNPKMILKGNLFKAKHPAITEIITHGMMKIAARDANQATKIWQNISKLYPFTERHWGLVVREIGLSHAYNSNPEAVKWLQKVPNKYHNNFLHEWRVRSCIGKQNWQSVLKWINRMPADLAKQEKWQYWRARALKATQNYRKSSDILRELAKKRCFYGFLASHQLSYAYPFNDENITVSEKMITKMQSTDFFLRINELIALKKPNKANVEWNFAIKQMNETEKHTAAIIAHRINQPNWSIMALAKAQNKNNLKLRFPTTYSEYIVKESHKNNIDPALVFALTRQESAFVPTAKSKAGALGLMQIVPSTAFMISKKHKIKVRRSIDILKPNVNIIIGTKYLKKMINKYQKNTVLALAAYNAGPNRINRWLPKQDTPTDIWIELIPYTETREYVQNIVTYAVIYQNLLGKKPKLQQYLPNFVSAK